MDKYRDTDRRNEGKWHRDKDTERTQNSSIQTERWREKELQVWSDRRRDRERQREMLRDID